MIYISSNNVRHPVTKTFTPLRYTSPNYTLLYFTTPVDSSLLLIWTSWVATYMLFRVWVT